MTADHVVLAATAERVPDTDWSAASVKSLQFGDGEAYTASLRYRGTKVADIENDGRGGTPIVHWKRGNAAADHRAVWAEWVSAYNELNKDDEWFEPEYFAIVSLIDEYEIAKQLRRDSKRFIPVLVKGANLRRDGQYALIRGQAEDPRMIEAIRAKGEVDRYWDGENWMTL